MSETKIKITIEAPEEAKGEATRLADIVQAAHTGDIDVEYKPATALTRIGREMKEAVRIMSEAAVHSPIAKQKLSRNDRSEKRDTALLDMIETTDARKEYFARLCKWLSPDDVLLLANGVAIMEAIEAYIDLREALPEGFTWRDIANQVRSIYDDFPHKLPLKPKPLHGLFIQFTRDGFEALIN